MVTFKRPPNLRDKLIRARISDPPIMRSKRQFGYIRNLHTNLPTGEHFNLPGHELYHLKVSVWDLGRNLLEGRESRDIRDFMTEPSSLTPMYVKVR